jgi:hypothetical protein
MATTGNGDVTPVGAALWQHAVARQRLFLGLLLTGGLLVRVPPEKPAFAGLGQADCFIPPE